MPFAIKSPLLSQRTSFSHGFMTRNGGVSTGFFSSLNAAIEKQDNPDHVLENRRRIAFSLGAKPENLITLRQIHSNRVSIVDAPFNQENKPSGDALVTRTPGLLIGVITADCVPILLADPQNKVVGAIHAGWKGAIGGIIEETIKTMETIMASREKILAAIGPCIWQESYEVDQNFLDAFIEKDPAHGDLFLPQGDRYLFDLPGFVTKTLLASGIKSICPSPANTYTNEDQFFSFRRKTHRNEPLFGCGFSGIML